MFRPSGGDFEGWRRVFQRRIAQLSDVKNASKTRNSPRWANKILKPVPENSVFSGLQEILNSFSIRLCRRCPSMPEQRATPGFKRSQTLAQPCRAHPQPPGLQKFKQILKFAPPLRQEAYFPSIFSTGHLGKEGTRQRRKEDGDGQGTYKNFHAICPDESGRVHSLLNGARQAGTPSKAPTGKQSLKPTGTMSGIQEKNDEFFMREALKQARIAYQEDEVPVGAVIVWQDRILSRACNYTEKLKDATAHAEMQAITAASQGLGGKYLNDCTLYVTLEPCPMCAGALYWAQIGRIVYGASDPKRGYMRIGPALLHPKTQVTEGVLAEECAALLKKFFQEKRK